MATSREPLIIVSCNTPPRMFAWKKKNDGFTVTLGPFVANVMPKGDGRWNWEVFADNATGSQASGVASSTGAAKRTAEELMKRSGRV